MGISPERLRRVLVLTLVCATVAAVRGASAAPLPAEFGGGFIPPDSPTKSHERRTATATGDFFAGSLNSLLYCGWRGVERVRASKPSQLAECVAHWATLYDRHVKQIDPPACLDRATTRLAAEGLAMGFNAVFWCAPPTGTPLPPEFGTGGFVPNDGATFRGEKGVAQAFARLFRQSIACYRRGVDNVFGGDPSGTSGCINDAFNDFTQRVASLVPPQSAVPACVPTDLAGVAVALAKGFNPIFYCAE